MLYTYRAESIGILFGGNRLKGLKIIVGVLLYENSPVLHQNGKICVVCVQ
jgi:hypothetical protein